MMMWLTIGLIGGTVVGVLVTQMIAAAQGRDPFGGPLSDDWQPGRTEEKK
jgi:hypothetical protein